AQLPDLDPHALGFGKRGEQLRRRLLLEGDQTERHSGAANRVGDEDRVKPLPGDQRKRSRRVEISREKGGEGSQAAELKPESGSGEGERGAGGGGRWPRWTLWIQWTRAPDPSRTAYWSAGSTRSTGSTVHPKSDPSRLRAVVLLVAPIV